MYAWIEYISMHVFQYELLYAAGKVHMGAQEKMKQMSWGAKYAKWAKYCSTYLHMPVLSSTIQKLDIM